MKRIPLSATSGNPRAYALVDDEDYDRFGSLAWTLVECNGLFYANRNIDGHIVYLHRAISGCERGDGNVVDHRNGDGLDNQRANLRVTTHARNARNRRSRVFGTSRYRGVYWNTRRSKWFARAKVNYKHVWLGAFDDEHEAGAAVEAFWCDFDATALDAVEFKFESERDAA